MRAPRFRVVLVLAALALLGSCEVNPQPPLPGREAQTPDVVGAAGTGTSGGHAAASGMGPISAGGSNAGGGKTASSGGSTSAGGSGGGLDLSGLPVASAEGGAGGAQDAGGAGGAP